MFNPPKFPNEVRVTYPQSHKYNTNFNWNVRSTGNTGPVYDPIIRDPIYNQTGIHLTLLALVRYYSLQFHLKFGNGCKILVSFLISWFLLPSMKPNFHMTLLPLRQYYRSEQVARRSCTQQCHTKISQNC